MFEKEAEEYCMHQSLLEDVRDNICKAFEDGAEFGYNKAFVEVDKNLKAIVTELSKAKEIIKDFILISKVEHLKDRYETVDEAEQFISEVEE